MRTESAVDPRRGRHRFAFSDLDGDPVREVGAHPGAVDVRDLLEPVLSSFGVNQQHRFADQFVDHGQHGVGIGTLDTRHLDVVDGEQRRSEDGQHCDDDNDHAGDDPPPSEPAPTFGSPYADPALPQTRLDPWARGILREQRVAGSIIVDEHRLRVVATTESLVEVHRVREIVTAADRDRGQRRIGHRGGLGVVVAERDRQFSKHAVIGLVRAGHFNGRGLARSRLAFHDLDVGEPGGRVRSTVA